MTIFEKNSSGKSIHQTREGLENFSKWFGTSKILSEDGLPLVVYHGTKEDFSSFDVYGTKKDYEEGEDINLSGADLTAFIGSHFAKEVEVANKFARGLYGSAKLIDGGLVMPVYLSIKNPAYLTEDDLFSIAAEGAYDAFSLECVLNHEEEEMFQDARSEGFEGSFAEYSEVFNEKYGNDFEFRKKMLQKALESENEYDRDSYPLASMMGAFVREELTRKGFDGVVYPNAHEGGTSYIIFDPRQVKSAIGNNGDFNELSDSLTDNDSEVAKELKIESSTSPLSDSRFAL